MPRSEQGPVMGIMQPYLFPYIGYFQYIAAVDRFVIYDDVSFIMRGWINRNRILVQGEPGLFTAPLSNASPNVDIREVLLSGDHRWAGKLLRTLEMAYGKAPFFRETMSVAGPVLSDIPERISDLALAGLSAVSEALGLETAIVPTSTVYGNRHMGRKERIVDICRREGSSRCIVPEGGAHLYPREEFAAEGITLSYIAPVIEAYSQHRVREFVPSLSIIDVLMWNGVDRTADMVRRLELV